MHLRSSCLLFSLLAPEYHRNGKRLLMRTDTVIAFAATVAIETEDTKSGFIEPGFNHILHDPVLTATRLNMFQPLTVDMIQSQESSVRFTAARALPSQTLYHPIPCSLTI